MLSAQPAVKRSAARRTAERYLIRQIYTSVLANLNSLSRLVQRDTPCPEGGQIAAFHAQHDGPNVIAGVEPVAPLVVARGHGKPLIRPDAQRSAVLEHCIDERALHLGRISARRI